MESEKELINSIKSLCEFFGFSKQETNKIINNLIQEEREHKNKNKTSTNRVEESICEKRYISESKYNELYQENEGLRKKIDSLCDGNEKFRKRNSELSQENEMLRKNINELYKSIDSLCNGNDKLRKKNGELYKLIDGLCDGCTRSDSVGIDRISFNEQKRTTSITFDDKNKVTVKAHENDSYDKYVGFAMAYMHHLFGSRTKFRNFIDSLEGKPNVYYIHRENDEKK